MEIVKKNILSILCGVVALVAIVAIFWPGGSRKADVQAQLDQRKAQYTKAQGLLTKPRHMPVILPAGGDSAASDLKSFPSQTMVEVGQKAVDDLKNQSTAIVDAAVKINQRPPLLPNFFPAIGDRAQFQRQYDAMFEADGPIRGQNGLDSATPPDKAEVDNRWKKRVEEIEKGISRGPNGQEYNREQIEQQKHAEEATFEQNLRDEAAKKHKIYLDPTALAQSPALAPTAGQSAKDDELWYAQMGLWVEMDVVSTIHRLNARAPNVTESPVKQVESLTIPFDATMYWPAPTDTTAAPAASSGDSSTPAPASTSDTDPLTPNFTDNPTGRMSNALYDVVHFTLTLDVDAGAVQSVLTELEAGKFITVYQVDAESVDSVTMAEQGFVFGKRPVARLALKCEALFLRKWTKPLMPAVIKTLLKIPDDQAQPQATQQQASAVQ